MAEHPPVKLLSTLKHAGQWVIPTLMGLIGLVVVWLSAQQAEAWLYDLFSRWAAKPAQNSPVRLVMIDDPSLNRLSGRYGLPPWPRSAYVDIFKRLNSANPAVIAFDGHFMNIQRPDDRQVFEALKTMPNLVVGLVHRNSGDAGDSILSTVESAKPQTSRMFYYQLNLGVVNVEQDPKDGIIRKIRVLFPPTAETPGVFPSLSLASVLEYQRFQSPEETWGVNVGSSFNGGVRQISLYTDSQPENQRIIDVDEQDGLKLRWQALNSPKAMKTMGFSGGHPPFSHQAMPLWQVLDEQQWQKTQAWLQGKIILIGSSASLYQDYHHTPLSTHHLGADIQATAIDTLLSGKGIQAAPGWINLLILLAGLVLIITIRLLMPLSKTILYTVGTMIVFFWLAFWLFETHSVWIHTVTPEVFMALGILLANFMLVSRRDRQVALLEGHLSKLVSQSVFQEIKAMSRIITQGGRKLTITAMFVDLRNFTRLAEQLPPHQVTDLLNEFYAVVVDTVFEYRGTVDKFMGDGVLILFGAPVTDSHHAELAVQAARVLLEKTQELSESWKARELVDTHIGISIHTGSAFVGFIGPKSKLEYTAIGDTINLCVRLQEQTKTFNTPLIISQNTRDALPETQQPDLAELAEVTVRGREAPILIYHLPSSVSASSP